MHPGAVPGAKEMPLDNSASINAGQGRAQYLSATCVVFTNYSGDTASVVDEHFSRALNSSKGKWIHQFNWLFMVWLSVWRYLVRRCQLPDLFQMWYIPKVVWRHLQHLFSTHIQGVRPTSFIWEIKSVLRCHVTVTSWFRWCCSAILILNPFISLRKEEITHIICSLTIRSYRPPHFWKDTIHFTPLFGWLQFL